MNLAFNAYSQFAQKNDSRTQLVANVYNINICVCVCYTWLPLDAYEQKLSCNHEN